MDAASISQLDDRDFRELITDNIHPADDNKPVWDLLTEPELAERTHDMLRTLRRQAEGALGKRRREIEDFKSECFLHGPRGKQDWFAAKREYEEWKRRANSFRFMVEARQAQARTALKSARATAHEEWQTSRPPSRKRVLYHDALRDLVSAVQQHQASFAASGRRATQQDHDLWRRLDSIVVPVTEEEDASLRDMFMTFWAETEPDADSERRRSERLMRQAPAGRSAPYEGVPKARRLGNDKHLS